MPAMGSFGGLVVLAGAGPGEGSLLTLAARKYLELAEVVVYDRLAGLTPLRFCRPEAERIYVGKTPGAAGFEQSQINELLVQKARAGRLVVRLKGGDPFVFGRGGEEATALAEAHVPYRVVPGVTAALAAGAYAGIPLTDRRLASTLAFVTGQEDPAKERTNINWQALAGIDTVVFYMGVRDLPQIAANLIAAGRSGDTPAALVASAGTPRQRTVTATLATLASAAESARIVPPAVTIVGHVVGLREKLAWFEQLPLFGQTVLVTRASLQAADLSERLAEMGSAVIECPTLEIAPPTDFSRVDAALRELGRYALAVFTSVNGVEAFVARCRELGLDARALAKARLAAIGRATAEALRRHFLQPEIVPDRYTTEALAGAIVSAGVAGQRVLLARADIATDELPEALKSAGAVVDEVAFYRTIAPKVLAAEAVEALQAGQVDWITFASSSAVENFLVLAERAGVLAETGKVKLAAIGPATARTLRQRGLTPALVAEEHTIDGLLRAMIAGASKVG